MADHLVNGLPVVDGTLSLPRTGLWVADVLFSGGVGASVGDAVEFESAGVIRHGTVIRADNAYLTPRARIVAGNGRLYTEVSARDYRGYMLGRIAQDALGDAGEAYDDTWTQILSQQALHFAAQGVLSGTQDLVVAGGSQAMNAIPISAAMHATAAAPWRIANFAPLASAAGARARGLGGVRHPSALAC